MKNNYKLQQQYMELYEYLYKEMIESGMKADKAQNLAYAKTEHTKNIIESTLEELDKDSWYCGIRLSKRIQDIPNWDNLTYQEKELCLYNLGFDVRLPWRLKYGYHPKLEGAPEQCWFVEGSELISTEWMKTGRASMEAILQHETVKRGYNHRRDLERLNRQ
jgi:hypothetical protein